MKFQLKHFLIPLNLLVIIGIVFFFESYYRKKHDLEMKTDFYSQGLAYMTNDEIYPAIRSFEAELKKSPSNFSAYFGLGWAHHKEKSLEKASANYDKAYDSAKKLIELVVFNQAIIYEERGEIDRAVEKFKVVLFLNPKSPNAHFNLALLEEKLQNLDAAKAHYIKTLELDPGFAKARTRLDALKSQ